MGMTGTKKVNHGSMGMMPTYKPGMMHGSMGELGRGEGKTDVTDKATSPAAGKQHSSAMGGKGKPAKQPKMRPASFGK